ncbi:polysaccharide deacetylase family protein [Ruminococcaceae bacterium OttesenSCG-928-A11]|nr:polysaccharide deacetylase family protein [Ruminococcaceae bacterium OttesenSCG-928-A11]
MEYSNLTSSVTVLPWNGYHTAISLTFDDGDISQSDIVLPSLEARGMRGTFFLTVNWLKNEDKWQRAYHYGHEIGNHSMSHRMPFDFTLEDVVNETIVAKNKLEERFSARIVSYAYPYTLTSPQMIEELSKSHLGARIGQLDSYYMQADSTPDWYALESVVTLSDIPIETYIEWVDKSSEYGAWTVFQMHAVEGTIDGYQPIPLSVFDSLLDYLSGCSDVWIATFGEVCAYWRASKILEGSIANTPLGSKVVWNKPPVIPEGIYIKVLVNTLKKQIIVQDGKPAKEIEENIYSISFDKGNLALKYKE